MLFKRIKSLNSKGALLIHAIALFWCVLLLGGEGLASENNEADILTIGIVDNYLPCSDSYQDESYSGWSVDIWREIQEKLIDKSYRFVKIDTFDKAVEMSSEGKVDLVTSCHTITPERLEKVDFSVPYVTNSVSMLSRKNNYMIAGKVIKLIRKPHVLRSLLALLVVTGAVAVITNSRVDHDRKKHNILILPEVLRQWTLLFIGQSHEELASRRLRNVPFVFIAGCTQILLVTVLVAELTTINLESSRVIALEDLDRSSLSALIQEGLAVVEGTETQRRLLRTIQKKGIPKEEFQGIVDFPQTLPEMTTKLIQGEYNHILASNSVLEYIIKNLTGTKDFEISIVSSHKTPEAFLFGKKLDQKTRLEINRAIAEMNYNGRMNEIINRYN